MEHVVHYYEFFHKEGLPKVTRIFFILFLDFWNKVEAICFRATRLKDTKNNNSLEVGAYFYLLMF